MIALWTAGSIIKNPSGSIENKPGEGVQADLHRWIRFERSGLEAGREKRGLAGQQRIQVAAPLSDSAGPRWSSSNWQLRPPLGTGKEREARGDHGELNGGG